MNAERLLMTVSKMLESIELHDAFNLIPIEGGGNNKAYRVESGVRRFFLKEYFHHPNDRRDRAGAEFAFSCFAWKQSLRSLPQPMAYDRENRLGLYEFIDGRRLAPDEIHEREILCALRFFQELNQRRDCPDARNLLPASESCFSPIQHLQCVERRLNNLNALEEFSIIDTEAKTFVQMDLFPVWTRIRTNAIRSFKETDISLERELTWEARCLSPSDFGFHNALIESNGEIRFLDFEYAGWDDPAKTVCDFFCQIAVPAPMIYYPKFMETVTAGFPDSERNRKRINALFPVYQIKWCCILLNEFLNTGFARRLFSNQESDLDERKRIQLEKAHAVLRRVFYEGVS